MMTSTGELLDQAQREAWNLLRDLPTAGWNRRATARPVAQAHMQSWPALAAQGSRALRSTLAAGESYERYRPAVTSLDMVSNWTSAGTPTDPQFARLSAVLGAVADLTRDQVIQGGWSESDQALYRDKIGAVLESVARSTRGYVEVSWANDSPWRRGLDQVTTIEENLRSAAVTRPGERAGAMDDIGVPDLGSDLQTSVAEWRRSVEDHLRPKVAASSPGVLASIATDAAVTSRALAAAFSAAGHGGAVDQEAARSAAAAFATATKEWQRASRAWEQVRGGAGGTEEHFRAGQRLHRSIMSSFHNATGWRRGQDLARDMSLPQLAELCGEARWVSQQLDQATQNYAQVGQVLLEKGAALVAGEEVRRDVREDPLGRRSDLLRLRLNEYVPVPKGVPLTSTKDLLAAAVAAQGATRDARAAGAITARVPASTWPAGTTRASGVGSPSAPYVAPSPAAASFPGPATGAVRGSAQSKSPRQRRPVWGRPGPEAER